METSTMGSVTTNEETQSNTKVTIRRKNNISATPSVAEKIRKKTSTQMQAVRLVDIEELIQKLNKKFQISLPNLYALIDNMYKADCKQKKMTLKKRKEIIDFLFEQLNEKFCISFESLHSFLHSLTLPPCLQLLESQRPVYLIKRNQFGHYEHAESGFIFDEKTHQVLGKHVGFGIVKPLEQIDIDACLSYYNFTLKKD
jgi:uncharacterized protein YqfB (UPF0267 family)